LLKGDLTSLTALINKSSLFSSGNNFSFSTETLEKNRQATINKYQTAISETLNAATTPVSKATAELLG